MKKFGLIKFSDGLAVKDVESKSLQVKTLKQKQQDMKEEDIEKKKIADSMGIDSDDIISVISIEDREGGSKLFNYDMEGAQKPLIVRLKNNKFKVLKEDENGEKKEMVGFEATPVSKQVASLLKDTNNNLFTTLKPGEVRAGKTNPNQNEYNIFQIKRAGESKDDDLNNLLFVSTSGRTDMNIIESRERGEFRFDKAPQSTVYPQNIYIENSNGVTKKKEITYSDQTIKFPDIEKRKELLEKLIEIEDMIQKIIDTSENIEEKKDMPTADISDELADSKNKLPDLYSTRSKILYELGMKEKDIIKAEEELEHMERPGFRSRV